MPKVNRYPRGYVSVLDRANLEEGGISKDDVSKLPSDGTVQDLYKIYIERSVNTEGWEYRKRVIEIATRLFGDFHQWLYDQAVYNDSVYGLNFEFIKDTLQFIRTGHRQMSVFQWNELVLENPDPKQGEASTKRVDEYGISDPKEFENYLSEWLAKENGFEDMLCTVHVLYGVSKISPPTPGSLRYKF